MARKFLIAASMALAMLACHAQAQTFAQMKVCKSDVQQHCASVQPGGGRLADCLAQQQAKLTPACQAQLPVITQCSQQVRAVCGDQGAEKMRSCAQANRERLTTACAGKAG